MRFGWPPWLPSLGVILHGGRPPFDVNVVGILLAGFWGMVILVAIWRRDGAERETHRPD
jgi:hypothetical protein